MDREQHMQERRTDHELRQLVDRILAEQRRPAPVGVRRARMVLDAPRHPRSPARKPRLGGACTR